MAFKNAKILSETNPKVLKIHQLKKKIRKIMSITIIKEKLRLEKQRFFALKSY